MKFIKKSELQLVNGNYLSDNEENPVFNEEFVRLQKEAHYIAIFAKECEGKDFVGKEPDSISEVKRRVQDTIREEEKINFVKPTKREATPTMDQLKKEALSFITFISNKKVDVEVNNFMQKFKIINDFEKHGLFFSEGVVKLDKIYTIKEIMKNLKGIVDLL